MVSLYAWPLILLQRKAVACFSANPNLHAGILPHIAPSGFTSLLLTGRGKLENQTCFPLTGAEYMGFKETIEQHPLPSVAGAFAAGCAACWAAAQVLWIGPRDYTIQELKNRVSDLEVKQGKELTSDSIVDPPSILQYQVQPASASHENGSWFNGLTEMLAWEGRNESNTILVRYDFAPFENGYRRFEIEFSPLASVTLRGGYAFYVRSEKNQRFYHQVPIDFSNRSITVPQSRKGDALVVMLRMIGPKSEHLDRLAGVKIK